MSDHQATQRAVIFRISVISVAAVSALSALAHQAPPTFILHTHTHPAAARHVLLCVCTAAPSHFGALPRACFLHACVSFALLTQSLQLTGPHVQRPYGRRHQHQQPDLFESELCSATVAAGHLGRRRSQPAAATALAATDAAAQPAAAVALAATDAAAQSAAAVALTAITIAPARVRQSHAENQGVADAQLQLHR